MIGPVDSDVDGDQGPVRRRRPAGRPVLAALCLVLTAALAPAASAAEEISIGEAVRRFTAGGERQRVAVFDFTNTGGRKTRFDAYIADTIVTELSRYPVTLLERKRLETLLGEQALSQTGVIDEAEALKLGTLLPVDVVVSGSYTQFGGRLVVNGRFIHVGTGKILSAFTSAMDIDRERGTDTAEKKDAGRCDAYQEPVRKALYDLTGPEAIERAVVTALQVPFDEECKQLQYGILSSFGRQGIFDRRYKLFLIKAMASLERPSDDRSAREILAYFAANGIDLEEWAAGVETLKKMRVRPMNLSLRYLLNAERDDRETVLARVDEIMDLAVAGRIGRPVPAGPDAMLYEIMSALLVRGRDRNRGIGTTVFRKYQHVVPDIDKDTKKAVGILRSLYFDTTDRNLSLDARSLLTGFLAGRTPTGQVAESTADLFKSVVAGIEDRYHNDEQRAARYREDLAVFTKDLRDLYCRSVRKAQHDGYPYVLEERWIFSLRSGMQCGGVPGIRDLERDMRSRGWKRKLKAAETLSKIGEAAKEAEATVIVYLGQQGFGRKGGQLRKYCAVTLGNIRTTDPKGISLLIASFPDYNEGVSYAAEEAIAKIGADAVPYLIKGLRDKQHATRLRCAKALGNMGRKARKALPRLKEVAAKDRDGYVRREAQGAVQMIENDY